jgi:DNA (cytosine-5)-methyltransferase 1
MTQPLVLSLFPGIGLLDMAFEEAGFCVVRGPDLLWGGDVRAFHPTADRFDGIIGGPPCQLFSAFKRLNPRCGEKHGNMIPEFERVVNDARPHWFVMENVEAAPEPNTPHFRVRSQLVRDDWVGGETSRLRRFSFGVHNFHTGIAPASFTIEQRALHGEQSYPAVCSDARIQPVAIGGSGKRKAKPGVPANRVTSGNGPRLSIAEMLRRQGAPPNLFAESPFTDTAIRKMIGNGVPLPMGRAIANAVKRAMYPEFAEAAS